jgi:hypothetical protein
MKATSDLVDIVVRLLRAGQGWSMAPANPPRYCANTKCYTQIPALAESDDRVMVHTEAKIRIFLTRKPVLLEVDSVFFNLRGGHITALQKAVAARATNNLREAALGDLQRQIEALEKG